MTLAPERVAGQGSPLLNAPRTEDVPWYRRARPADWPVVRAVLGVWVLTRVATYLAALVAVNSNAIAGVGGASGFRLPAWNQWDTVWYNWIAQHGYFHPNLQRPALGAYSQAYFPGMPFAMRVVHVVVPFWTADGMIVSFVAGGVVMVALARLAAFEFGWSGDRVASGTRAAIYILASPYAVFLMAAYTEALFLGLAIPAWLCARTGRWGRAALLCGLASAVRAEGLFLALALVVLWITTRRSWGERVVVARAAWLPLSFGGIAVYFAYLWARTGDPMAWEHAEHQGWLRRTVSPITSLHATLHKLASPIVPMDFRTGQIFELLAVVVAIVIVVALVRSHWYGEATFVTLVLLSLATSANGYMSIARASLVWFPLWVGLAGMLERRPWLRASYLTLSTPIAAVMVVAFVSGHWVN